MLFDLQGKRKNAVKVIYAGLAVLMGGGLVLFGVGGATSGGLLDAFSGGGGGSVDNGAIQDRIDKQEKRLQATPNDQAALRALVRNYYQLATSRIPENSSVFPQEAQGDLLKSDLYWQRYVKAVGDKKVNLSLAGLAGQLYGPGALNKPPQAQEVYRLIAEQTNDLNAYLQLVSAATIAGDKRTVNLATIKALDLTPKKQRKDVERQIKEIKKQAQAQAAQAQSASGS